MSRNEFDAPTERYPDHGPIALDSRHPGNHSYANAIAITRERVQAIKNHRKRELAHIALMALVARQGVRNQGNFSEVESLLSEEERQRYTSVVSGDAATPEYVRFLHNYPQQESIEIARLIHPGDWDVRAAIDDPVRQSLLDPASRLETEKCQNAAPHYKIIQFDSNQPIVTIDRKRRGMMSHFGGAILTTIRNSLLVDMDHAPDVLTSYLLEEKKMLTTQEYNYDQHVDLIGRMLEHHIRERNAAHKPRWAIPLMTTYYSALRRE